MRSIVMLAVVSVVGFSSAPAAADEAARCIAASDAAQSLRDKFSLIEARAKLLSCARPECPQAIRNDCMDEQARIETELPTVVPVARLNGRDLADARVELDGRPLAPHLEGRAFPVNPGSHVLRFEFSGAAAVEHALVANVGEKNRLVVVEIAPPPPVGAAPEASRPAPRAKEPRRNTTPAAFLFGAAAAAAVPMATLWVLARNDIDAMRRTCAPQAGGAGCPADRVDAARMKLVAADVLLAVAATGVAAGTAFLLWPSGESKRDPVGAITVGATPLNSGGFVSAGGHF